MNLEEITTYKYRYAYKSYISMVGRCTDKSHVSYQNYGGRGIKICDKWLGRDGFKRFFLDMGNRPEGMTLDRIDNDGNYCPENCRWATPKEQARNRRNNHIVNGKTVSELAEVLGIPRATIESRIRYGNPIEESRGNRYPPHPGVPLSTVSMRVNVYGWSVERACSEAPRKRG